MSDLQKLEKILTPVHNVAEVARLLCAEGPLVLYKPRIVSLDSDTAAKNELRLFLTVERGRIGTLPLRYTVTVRADTVMGYARVRKIITAVRKKVM